VAQKPEELEAMMREGCVAALSPRKMSFDRFAFGRVLMNELGSGDGSIGIGMKN
jgi:hypothetical protein